MIHRPSFHDELEERMLKRESKITEEYSKTEEFIKGNEEFRSNKLFYFFVKTGVIILTCLIYLLSIGMFLSPFIGWFFNKIYAIFPGALLLAFSPHIFVQARGLHKRLRLYFKPRNS